MNADRVSIRYAVPADEAFLRDMVYLSIHVPPGSPPVDRAVLDEPPLDRLYRRWGRRGDIGCVAETIGSGPMGAAWVRLYSEAEPMYGFVASDIPVLAVAVETECRGRGVGTLLLRSLIEEVQAAGYPGISLSVDAANPAKRLYERLGFAEVDSPRPIENDANPVLLLRFRPVVQ